jgi:rhodanese-related sulfurtransferase/CBS domain-containing protein
MFREVDRRQLQDLMAHGAQVVEVLPAEEYEDEHLPGAVNIPLRRLDREAPERLSKDRPVVVYCYDSACDVSPRAAWRLLALGFTDVVDYPAGKYDWAAAGLPVEGKAARLPRLAGLARTDAPTCTVGETVGQARERTEAVRWERCWVLNDEGIVQGQLREKELAVDPSKRVEDAMLPGPSTFRPNVSMQEMRETLQKGELRFVPVTTNEGRWIGAATREDVERAAEAAGTAPESTAE